METPEAVTGAELADGLRELGLGRGSEVIVHSSLSSFGYVDGGAEAVCSALTEVCGTVLMPAGTWDLTGIPAPPGLVRPHNAYWNADSWADFDTRLSQATSFRAGLPIDRWLGTIPETFRLTCSPFRTEHPLFSYQAAGPAAERLLEAQRPDWPLGPIEALDGDVLLLGVTHTSNTTIHLAEQHLGRSRFYRYARSADGLWTELPNVPGASHHFDAIEPVLRSATKEIQIGNARIRRIPKQAVLAATRQLIEADPAALLCTTDPACRCAAALQQRLAALAE
ncbi:AAC(3) family N-acetyltransferase [Kribbella sindirgiensis]|uniref:Aminoglycoside N(3)-acetyltransferase n=1 Tax=Kribbella sindirgiensis TaxID=1124744 RepID=A0A4R0J2N6_9ACTN|nr:AAC(3) family N-acetyltransferase [Kribbella sindirgiensis]TCC39680.1 AAC(3) family N-acetyltransferase [Kribbella sindirgiensis]